MGEPQKTILCVDDEPIILKSLNRLLMNAGYRVFTAESGTQGLELVGKENVDVIIADQRMPFMTGSEFLRIVHQQQPHIVSIMLSGYSDFDSLVAAVNDGEIFRFVAKPWDNEVLLTVIRSALEKKKVRAVAANLLETINSMSMKSKGVAIEASQNDTGINVRVLEGGKIFSEQMIFAFLNSIFDTLGVSADERIKMVSGAVTNRKGKVVLFINVGQGIMLNIEIPKEENQPA